VAIALASKNGSSAFWAMMTKQENYNISETAFSNWQMLKRF
jgi:hypothetical protein